MVKKFFEFVENDIKDPLKSFYLKDDLNPAIWSNFELDIDVKDQLVQIAEDFYESLDLDAKIQDIVLTGSLANYNWSEKYSDFDLHILIDFTDVNDDEELVKKFVDAAKTNWNDKHNIEIKGYDVEIYVQDVDEPHQSSGVYSLLNNKWKVKPSKFDFKIDEKTIEKKARSIMSKIDLIEGQLDNCPYEEFIEKVDKIWDKVKNLRKEELYSSDKGAELSTGNLIFKLLRRNGYIEKIIKLKRQSYDNQFN